MEWSAFFLFMDALNECLRVSHAACTKSHVQVRASLEVQLSTSIQRLKESVQGMLDTEAKYQEAQHMSVILLEQERKRGEQALLQVQVN